MVSTRSSSGITPRPPKSYDAGSDIVPTKNPRRAATKSPRSTAPAGGHSHKPTPLTLLWLAVSLPLVAWDTGYVLGRPHTMPGGSLHWPLWVPYELYGRVDHVYGSKAWDAGLGFTGAQGMMNLVETVLYAVYWGLWWRNKDGRGAVGGRAGGLAVTVGFAASVMTFSKTVLYWLNEYYSGFDNIGHNSLSSLVWLWIIPNGLWLVFPCYMIYALGGEIVDALAGVSGPAVKDE
ncbi:hypothetical protein CONLIGDRAFT_163688 [Coniochaeta ligniaria NRRL 30616]|uniref:Emopamil-binding protein n=1 Tax=Coniochaeta ligniaria NRRL 30616 TaxID=1408157 RepID=A0A1J7JUW8_9PEZI|nr:hypothetical protein CONLIGDRAFT_163688 [Coniochaeta ligniaria NRRL 30616]